MKTNRLLPLTYNPNQTAVVKLFRKETLMFEFKLSFEFSMSLIDFKESIVAIVLINLI
jgi:hypothetical protein